MARESGRVSVSGMLESIDPQEWRAWRAFEMIEPGNATRICEVLALVGAAICNSLGASGIRPDQFWRSFADAVDVEESPKLQRAKLRLVVAAARANVGEGSENVSRGKPRRKSLSQLFFPDGRIE